MWIKAQTRACEAGYNGRVEQEPLPPFKSGFVAVVGRPNVGKSTLINKLLGQKIAAVSPRPQTTRRQQLGILSLDGIQIVFIDTPGIHAPRHKLGQKMNAEAREVLAECDVILALFDLSEPPQDEDQLIADALLSNPPGARLLLLFNKIDVLSDDELAARQQTFGQLLPEADSIPISAQDGRGLGGLIENLRSTLPEGDPFFPEDQVTDSFERDLAADLVREAALIHLQHEVPHSLAVRIDEFSEREAGNAYIRATLFVERDSQKGIVIGKGAKMLKRIGQHARKEIEGISDRRIFLDLRVKVRKNWRNDEKTLRQFGFKSG